VQQQQQQSSKSRNSSSKITAQPVVFNLMRYSHKQRACRTTAKASGGSSNTGIDVLKCSNLDSATRVGQKHTEAAAGKDSGSGGRSKSHLERRRPACCYCMHTFLFWRQNGHGYLASPLPLPLSLLQTRQPAKAQVWLRVASLERVPTAVQKAPRSNGVEESLMHSSALRITSPWLMPPSSRLSKVQCRGEHRARSKMSTMGCFSSARRTCCRRCS